MNLRLICLICILFGYLLGSFQTAYFVGRAKHVDLRKKGSGNLGTTNVLRVLGLRAGLFTFFIDIMKVFVAMAVVYIVVILCLKLPIPRIPLYLYTGLGTVLGHDFPYYLGFRGGKGVAATSAVLISLWDWKLIVVGVIVFFCLAFLTQYISVASMSLAVAEFIAFILFSQIGLIKIDPEWMWDCYIIIFIMSALIILRHRKNIKRLINKNENKFVFMNEQQIKSADSEQNQIHKESSDE